MKLALIIALSLLAINGGSAECPRISTQPNFSLESYIAAPWYIHQQAVIPYQPIENNYCVEARYTLKDGPSFPWGYTVSVDNYAEDADGNSFGGPLCAAPDKSGDPAKLVVAPCFLPQFAAGPYWVVAYDEEKGYALVSGGQPENETDEGCVGGDGVNNSGLWIFLRGRERDEGAIDEARTIAVVLGFDLSVLNDVDQTDCKREEGESVAMD